MKRNKIVRLPLLLILAAFSAAAGFAYSRPAVKTTEAERDAMFALRKYGAVIGQGDGGEAVYVDCSKSDITDEALVYLRQLPHLDRLALTDMPISDSGLVNVARRTTLRSINFAGTKITDTGLQHLKDLPRLTVTRNPRNL